MINKSVLFEAKAFLCLDKFPELSIKLIPIEDAVAFFYPPVKDVSTIIVFYNKQSGDFSQPLYLLFHEVGHFKQWLSLSEQNQEDEFWKLIELDKGEKKLQFEHEAWDYGEILLNEFFKQNEVNNVELIRYYKRFSEQCLLTYAIN